MTIIYYLPLSRHDEMGSKRTTLQPVANYSSFSLFFSAFNARGVPLLQCCCMRSVKHYYTKIYKQNTFFAHIARPSSFIQLLCWPWDRLPQRTRCRLTITQRHLTVWKIYRNLASKWAMIYTMDTVIFSPTTSIAAVIFPTYFPAFCKYPMSDPIIKCLGIYYI